jgi:hypothetical protein
MPRRDRSSTPTARCARVPGIRARSLQAQDITGKVLPDLGRGSETKLRSFLKEAARLTRDRRPGGAEHERGTRRYVIEGWE